MYEKCIKCERLGKDCIPNLYIMSVVEIRDWARKMKEERGWSNAYLSEVSGVPKGTIDSNFSKRTGKCADVNYSTFSPVICALIGSDSEMQCRSEDKNIEERVKKLEEENKNLCKRIEECGRREEETKQAYEERIQYFKDNIRWKKQIIVILIVIACILLSCVLCELIMDWENPEVGFFWR